MRDLYMRQNFFFFITIFAFLITSFVFLRGNYRLWIHYRSFCSEKDALKCRPSMLGSNSLVCLVDEKTFHAICNENYLDNNELYRLMSITTELIDKLLLENCLKKNFNLLIKEPNNYFSFLKTLSKLVFCSEIEFQISLSKVKWADRERFWASKILDSNK
jgi:hypothetical protein